MADKPAPKAPVGWGVLAVQSAVAAVVLLAVLLLRLMSGNAFQQVGDYFRGALQENALAAALDPLWENELTTVPTASTTSTTTATTATTIGTAPTTAP